ncbi:hypothetical protein AS180_00150 [Priestia veravalensis]|uniref:Uncharacterized protein n=1 Tax=Priestia veravalensis TaxID=1414648 RepID=A0A0V8JS99_9BACI|nr:MULTISPECIES: hypothetical protein [Priestia]KSU89816.1 hypothetical protein AS180_00150 [Priestia veravalensis]SCB74088.1 hypothetical protein GA0061087_100131 [Priestia flexa]
MRAMVIKAFTDKETLTCYSPGEVYEGEDEERFNVLQELGYIKKSVDESFFPRHVGGGYYELPNGEKIKGKDQAIKLMTSGEE